MDGIFKATAGQSRLEHVAVYLTTGDIGVGFSPHIADSPKFNLSELSEDAQCAFATFVGEIACLATGQKPEEVNAELVACVAKAVAEKEPVPEEVKP